MKKYTIGLITGALLAVSAMMFMGAKNALYNIDNVYRGCGLYSGIQKIKFDPPEDDFKNVVMGLLEFFD